MIDFRLYLVTDRLQCAPRALSDVVREACAAGVRAVQLREKDLDAGAIDSLHAELSAITREYGATLFVNHAHPVAEPAGIHYPEVIPIPEGALARRAEVPVGASTHSLDAAVEAARRGADFVTFGPVFETPAKLKYGAPQGLERLREVARACDVPVFAIGGVTAERAAQCVDAGARGVAVMGAIMAAEDVGNTVRAYENALGGL